MDDHRVSVKSDKDEITPLVFGKHTVSMKVSLGFEKKLPESVDDELENEINNDGPHKKFEL